MRLRVPPGRQGRLWLSARLGVAARGAELLEQKRWALMTEVQRLAAAEEQSRRTWETAAIDARRWLLRAVMLAGERQLELTVHNRGRAAEVKVSRGSVMGVVFPDHATTTASEGGLLLGGSAAFDRAVDAWRSALALGVQAAAAERAHAEVSREFALTARRERVIERVWLPALSAALRDLDLRLDEMERQDAIRARWVLRRREAGRAA